MNLNPYDAPSRLDSAEQAKETGAGQKGLSHHGLVKPKATAIGIAILHAGAIAHAFEIQWLMMILCYPSYFLVGIAVLRVAPTVQWSTASVGFALYLAGSIGLEFFGSRFTSMLMFSVGILIAGWAYFVATRKPVTVADR